MQDIGQIQTGPPESGRWKDANFRELVDTAPDAILVTERTGKILLANAQAVRLFGYSHEELIGNSIEILVPDQSRAAHVQQRENYARNVATRPMGTGLDLWARRKNGTEFPVDISLSPLRIEDALYVTAAIRDVTDKKESEARIRRLNSELQHKVAELAAANQELEAFCSSVAHDIRAPLRRLEQFSKILLDEANELSLEHREHLENIRAGARSLFQLSESLLSFSKLGQQPLTTQRVNLNAIVRNVVSQVQHDATFASNVPEWHVDDLPDVVCDNTLMRQVFWNLVSNAAKFSRNNLRPVIEIGQATKDEDHAFFVRDNGVGFDMKDAGTLFRLFRRLHSDEVFEGIGVGLANVRRIVEKHGGSVWATGAPGQGACFYFTLPSDLPETVL